MFCLWISIVSWKCSEYLFIYLFIYFLNSIAHHWVKRATKISRKEVLHKYCMQLNK
ncbi:MAG: hypothetical protein N7Q72_07215 [Spiroplasma sp. Tabriz.8]|nr:hypothetical protein [Spiroplasma sp. Tabriz.8]